VIFHCLKVSLDDFSRMNIEIISNLLENCGRYLLRNPDTSPRMSSFLETLQRKKAAQHIGQQERMLIENAMYFVNPPERAAIQQKERTPVELFVHKLIYADMNKRTYAKVLKSLRKLHWEEKEVVDLMEKVLSKPGKAKYSNIHLLAVLVGSLYRYHQEFVIGVIDNVLEQITIGLEHNDFKFNQRRISEVKYLGELYNYKMVDSPVIFDTLYRILTFGHIGGVPTREKLNPLDMPDDFFRIRLVCTLLDTCGVCFDRGMAKKKLDFFLTFFQYYIHTKEALPMDIEFLIQDTFALTRSNWKLAATFEEAWLAFAELTRGYYKTQESDKNTEVEAQEDDASSEEDGEDDDLQVPDMDDARSSTDDAEIEPVSNGDLKPGSDFEDDIVVTRQLEERDPEAEAEFDRELAKMMSESLDSRKFERKPVFDVPLPMRRGQRETNVAGDETPPETTSTTSNTMAFSLMTKKGNKQQTRSIELPSDSNFAIAMQVQKEAERVERQNIKNLVLNYDLQESGVDPAGPGGDKHAPAQHSNNASLHQPSLKSGADAKSADKSATNRSGHRARKLQLSDVDWT
jgi:regulator of nonsense transcripts 2